MASNLAASGKLAPLLFPSFQEYSCITKPIINHLALVTNIREWTNRIRLMKYDQGFKVELIDPVKKLEFLTEQMHMFQHMLEDVTDDFIADQESSNRGFWS